MWQGVTNIVPHLQILPAPVHVAGPGCQAAAGMKRTAHHFRIVRSVPASAGNADDFITSCR